MSGSAASPSSAHAQSLAVNEPEGDETMTDEKMQRLEELARAVLDGTENKGELYDNLGAQDVIDLVERARAAEHKGAEEMREAAAMVSQTAEAKTPGMRVGLHIVAGRIRSLPLPRSKG